MKMKTVNLTLFIRYRFTITAKRITSKSSEKNILFDTDIFVTVDLTFPESKVKKNNNILFAFPVLR